MFSRNKMGVLAGKIAGLKEILSDKAYIKQNKWYKKFGPRKNTNAFLCTPVNTKGHTKQICFFQIDKTESK